jgi:excisionase family DNA binding protein
MREREELLDIKQAAAYLNVSETSLRRWTNAGLLACLRVGRRRERRFRRSDLFAFMEVQSTEFGAGTNGSAPARRGEHVCMLYSTDAGRTRLAVSSIAACLRDGGHCILVAEQAVHEPVMTRLRRDHPGLRRALEAGRMTFAEYATTVEAQLAYFSAQFAAALRNGVESLHVLADIWSLAARITAQQLVAYEAAYERLANQFGVASGCLYDVRRFSGGQLLAALKGHRDTFSRPAEGLLG